MVRFGPGQTGRGRIPVLGRDVEPMHKYVLHNGCDLLKKFFRPLKEAFAHGRVLLAAEGGEFLQLTALLGIQARRHFDDQPGEQIAPLAAVDVHHAFAAEPKHLAALRASRDFELRFALEGGHLNFATERGDTERDRHFAVKIVVLALENFMFLDVNDDVKIAVLAAADPGFAVVRGTQPRAVLNSGGNFQFDPAQFLDPAFAVALPAGFLHHLADATAAWTGL